jgi:hypothetical protein
MPSRPLSADRSAVVKLLTRLDNEAIDLAVCAIVAHSVAATVSRVQLYWFEASSRGRPSR